jgi:hypothetical protein
MNVRNHRGEFNIGIFEKFLKTIQFGGLLLNQFLPIAGQIPEFTDGFGRNETPLDQTMAKQLGNPFTVFDVGFSAGYILDLSGIGQNHFHALFQDVENRFPIDSGAF